MAGQRISVSSANLVKVLIKTVDNPAGRMAGIMQNVSFQENFGHQGAYGIGRNNPFENVPGQARFSLSAGVMRLRKVIINAEITNLGFKNFEEIGIIPAVAADILKGLTFDIVVEDKEQGPLWTWKDCSYDGGSLDVRANQILSQNCSLLAIDRDYALNSAPTTALTKS
jgi:hypothetical protein